MLNRLFLLGLAHSIMAGWFSTVHAGADPAPGAVPWSPPATTMVTQEDKRFRNGDAELATNRVYRSSTRRSDLQPEQQIIMLLLSARSRSLKIMSR